MRSVSALVLESWACLPDEQIVDRVLEGETALFEVLMRRHNERLYRAARAILRDEAEVEDVLQQAYVNAYTHLRQFDRRAQFLTWLTRIAIHEALARARRRSRLTEIDPDRPTGSVMPALTSTADPERLAFAHELGALIEAAVDRLPDGAREVFMLRTVEGMSTEEVATALDVSIAVVKTRLSRARAMLRRELASQADDAAANAFRFLRPRCDRVVAGVLARIL
jgi:RNA polymerase sigma-70 factor (ECF subfamily)